MKVVLISLDELKEQEEALEGQLSLDDIFEEFLDKDTDPCDGCDGCDEGSLMLNDVELDFSEALDEMKDGSCMAREGWNGKGMYVYLAESENEDVLPCLMMCTVSGKHVPWVVSHTDLLAEDWYVVE